MTTTSVTTTRESSSGQDTGTPIPETAVQIRPSRSTLHSLDVRPVPASTVGPLMREHHYLHAMPEAAQQCFAAYLDEHLVGGAVFTAGSRSAFRFLAGADRGTVVTLARFWLSDAVVANGESRTLSVILRWLKRHTAWKAVVSYADPAAGHRGVIYQATGWLYLGPTGAERYIQLADGRLYHPRSVFTRYGTNSPGHLARTGVPAQAVRTPPKHRYLYVLDPAWRWRVRRPVLPYPKGRDPPSGADAYGGRSP